MPGTGTNLGTKWRCAAPMRGPTPPRRRPVGGRASPLTFYDCRPTSRGDLRLKSADPAAAAPAIRPNYLATGRDRRVAAMILEDAR